MKPKHILIVVLLAVVGLVAFLATTSEQPGQKSQSGDVITKNISAADGNSTPAFTLTLKEGDAEHESDHIFDSLQSTAIQSASLNTTTLELEVLYDGSQTVEADIREVLVKSGYLQVTADDTVAATLSSDGTSQALDVQVTDTLEPNLISAKAGVPLTITFGPGVAHLASISIAELGIEQDLTNGAVVEIADPQPGTYGIVCAEGVADGTLLVQ